MKNKSGRDFQRGQFWNDRSQKQKKNFDRHPLYSKDLPGGTVGYPAPPRLICPSVRESVCESVDTGLEGFQQIFSFLILLTRQWCQKLIRVRTISTKILRMTSGCAALVRRIESREDDSEWPFFEDLDHTYWTWGISTDRGSFLILLTRQLMTTFLDVSSLSYNKVKCSHWVTTIKKTSLSDDI
jgi:hypothetical protein